MSQPTQPRESLQIIIRLGDGETLTPIIVPIGMIGQLSAIIQAEIYRHKVPEYIVAENDVKNEQK